MLARARIRCSTATRPLKRDCFCSRERAVARRGSVRSGLAFRLFQRALHQQLRLDVDDIRELAEIAHAWQCRRDAALRRMKPGSVWRVGDGPFDMESGSFKRRSSVFGSNTVRKAHEYPARRDRERTVRSCGIDGADVIATIARRLTFVDREDRLAIGDRADRIGRRRRDRLRRTAYKSGRRS